MRRWKNVEWEAVAGIAAAVVALVLHLLHVVDQEVLLTVVLVLLALLLLGSIRGEGREERVEESLRALGADVARLRAGVTLPDAILIGPRALRTESERFAERGARRHDVVQRLLEDVRATVAVRRDAPARDREPRGPAYPLRARREGARDVATQVLPKVAACRGGDKVEEPRWTSLPETVSFILAETDEGVTEAHLSFWGEPFMAHTPGRDVPRYIFHVLGHSELIGRLTDVERDVASG